MATLAAPRIEIVSFPVEGMTCASCVNRITRFLSKVEGVELDPIFAAASMALSSVTVVSNALRLRRFHVRHATAEPRPRPVRALSIP